MIDEQCLAVEEYEFDFNNVSGVLFFSQVYYVDIRALMYGFRCLCCSFSSYGVCTYSSSDDLKRAERDIN